VLDLGNPIPSDGHHAGAVRNVRRTVTGGSRLTWLSEVVRDGAVLPVVVRVEGDGSFTGTDLSLAREAVAYRALGTTGVPVPGVLAVNDDGTAVVLERLPGSDLALSGHLSKSGKGHASPEDLVDDVLHHLSHAP
jgi:hypothetical protein